MSRHGYSDEPDNLAMWRGVIASALRGKRGQAFLRALLEALDGMPDKRLVEGELQTPDGAVCALGCLGKARGVDLETVDTHDWTQLGELFNIAPQLAQEVMFVNDEYGGPRDPEARWRAVRRWVAREIIPTKEELATRPPEPSEPRP